jgi:DMSO/TMAO reductase YedYZ molybdopterin-dependent catalytic subunit
MLARRSRLLSLIFCALVMSSGLIVTHAQTEKAATLAIGGDVPHPLTLSEADLQAMPRMTVTFTDHGVTTTYEGVRVSELLTRAGVPLGADLRGPALATYVLASAKDGYQVAFSLGELDPDLSGSRIIVADRADGKPLDGERGPFRIVSPQDTRGARSIRMLQRLEVVRLRK